MLSMLIASRLWIHTLGLLTLVGMALVASGTAEGLGIEAQDKKAWVRGRVLMPDGSPAKGATVSLATWESRTGSNARVMKNSDPVKTGKTGGFSISYSPEPDSKCKMTAKLEGYEPLEWRWEKHPSGAPKTFPARRLNVPCRVTGSIVGSDGELLTDGWRVVAKAQGDWLSFRRGSYRPFTPDPDTGEFQLEPLAPGLVEISGRHNTGVRTETVDVQVRPGEPAHVVLAYEGPDLDSSLSIEVRSEHYPGLWLGGAAPGSPSASEPIDPDRSYLFLLDHDGSVLAEAVQVERSYGNRWWFMDVPRAEYVVELRHPYFQPVRMEGVMIGLNHGIQLVGAAEIVLEVFSSKGVRIDEYELEIRYSGEGMRVRSFPLLGAGKPAPGGGRFEGLLPGNATLLLKSPVGESLALELGFLEPGEARHVRAQLESTLPIDVLVIDASGKPVEGLEVRAAMGTASDLDDIEGIFNRVVPASIPSVPEEVLRTNAEGQVCIVDAVAGRWTVRAIASSYADTTRTLDHPLPGGEALVLQLPVLGDLEGQLYAVPEFDWSMVDLTAIVDDKGDAFSWSSWLDEEPLIDGGGAFVLNGLPAGKVRLHLSLDKWAPEGGNKDRSITTKTVEIVGGPQRLELDLRPHLPAACKATVRLDGKPCGGARVVLVSQKRMERYEERARVRQVLGNESTTDSEGSAFVAGLNDGEAYAALIVGEEDAWIASVGLVEKATYASPARLVASLSMVEREVQIRSQSGEPLPKAEYGWACRFIAASGCKMVTSSNSRMTLRMPSGTYSLYRTGQRRPVLVPFEWQAGEGPLVIEMPEDE